MAGSDIVVYEAFIKEIVSRTKDTKSKMRINWP